MNTKLISVVNDPKDNKDTNFWGESHAIGRKAKDKNISPIPVAKKIKNNV